MKRYDYDIIVVGGGAAGITAAKTAHGFGKRVAIVEKNRLGGECTWTGCVPSKALIKAAQVAHDARHIADVGLAAPEIALNTSGVMNHVRSIVQKVYQTHTPDYFKKLGVDVLFGSPVFFDAHAMHVGDRMVTAQKFIVATGSSPFIPPIKGLDVVDYLTNETLFDLQELPKSLLILGGGAIGVEMASALNRLGVQVHIIEAQPMLLPREDADLVAQLSNVMRNEGVHIHAGLRVTQVEQDGDEVVAVCDDAVQRAVRLQAQALLVAVGRKPNIDGLGLGKVGVQTDKRGIIVDKTLRTTVSHIYACGDVAGPYLFSHMAWHQAVTAVRNMCVPLFKKKIDYTHVVWATFSAPELATAGLTEDQAREKYGATVQVYEQSYAIDRGYTDQTANGILKVICDKKGYILGAHALGERAGEIMHELQLAKVMGKKLASLQNFIHAYPTYSEVVWHAAKKAYREKLEKNLFVRLYRRFFV